MGQRGKTSMTGKFETNSSSQTNTKMERVWGPEEGRSIIKASMSSRLQGYLLGVSKAGYNWQLMFQ